MQIACDFYQLNCHIVFVLRSAGASAALLLPIEFDIRPNVHFCGSTVTHPDQLLSIYHYYQICVARCSCKSSCRLYKTSSIWLFERCQCVHFFLLAFRQATACSAFDSNADLALLTSLGLRYILHYYHLSISVSFRARSHFIPLSSIALLTFNLWQTCSHRHHRAHKQQLCMQKIESAAISSSGISESVSPNTKKRREVLAFIYVPY